MYFLRKHDVMFKKIQTTLFPVKFFSKIEKKLEECFIYEFLDGI